MLCSERFPSSTVPCSIPLCQTFIFARQAPSNQKCLRQRKRELREQGCRPCWSFTFTRAPFALSLPATSYQYGSVRQVTATSMARACPQTPAKYLQPKYEKTTCQSIKASLPQGLQLPHAWGLRQDCTSSKNKSRCAAATPPKLLLVALLSCLAVTRSCEDLLARHRAPVYRCKELCVSCKPLNARELQRWILCVLTSLCCLLALWTATLCDNSK